MSISGSKREDREPTSIEKRVKQFKDFTAEWPGPLDGRLGYSES